MKMICFRYPRNLITDILLCFICIFCITLILIRGSSEDVSVCGDSTDPISAFLDENGWIVDISSKQIEYKTIPELFDETYNEYQHLQKSQGFDLTDYKGKLVSHVSFKLKNFPGYENSDTIRINFLINNNEIIGADIMSTIIN